jgi:hypothetical protein
VAKHHDLSLEKLAKLLGEADYKTLPSLRATHVERAADGTVKLFYHDTAVVKWCADGLTELYSGGYLTATTKARINDALTGTPFSVWSNKGEWAIYKNGEFYQPFIDGVILGALEWPTKE